MTGPELWEGLPGPGQLAPLPNLSLGLASPATRAVSPPRPSPASCASISALSSQGTPGLPLVAFGLCNEQTQPRFYVGAGVCILLSCCSPIESCFKSPHLFLGPRCGLCLSFKQCICSYERGRVQRPQAGVFMFTFLEMSCRINQ